jgi:hypothetical protein
MGALDPGLDRLRQQLIEEIRASEDRTAQRFEALGTRIGAVEAVLGARIDTVEAGLVDLRHHVDATAAETRRHFDVIAEALRSNIVVVAEGVAVLDEKTERSRDEVREEFTKVDRRFLHLEARVTSALERR